MSLGLQKLLLLADSCPWAHAEWHVPRSGLCLTELCLCKQAKGFVPQQERGMAPVSVYWRTNLCVAGKMQASYGIIALAQKWLPPADLETVVWKWERAQEGLTTRECDHITAGQKCVCLCACVWWGGW